MNISRRTFLRNTAASTATTFAGVMPAISEVSRFTNPLKIPPLLEGTAGPRGKTYDLVAARGEFRFLQGLTTPTIGINGVVSCCMAKGEFGAQQH